MKSNTTMCNVRSIRGGLSIPSLAKSLRRPLRRRRSKVSSDPADDESLMTMDTTISWSQKSQWSQSTVESFQSSQSTFQSSQSSQSGQSGIEEKEQPTVPQHLSIQCEEDEEKLQEELEELIEAIEREQWPRLMNDYSPDTLKRLNAKLRSTEDYKGASLLHMALCFDPSLSVVAKLAKDLPEALTQQDILGRTPLHLAIELNSSRLVVGLLAKQGQTSCQMTDEEGKTPLHRCCESRSVDLSVVETLVEVSPSALDVEDDSDMCPLELAIVSGAPLNVVKVMQKAKRMWLIQV